jgi:hypothetical protein
MTEINKQCVSTTALVILLCLAICTGWLAIPAIMLLIQLATGRYGRLLRMITECDAPAADE